MEFNQRIRRLKQVIPFEAMYLGVGLACTVFPLALLFFPLVALIYWPERLHLISSEKPLIQNNIRLRSLCVIHGVLSIVPFFLPYPIFLQLFSSGWHLACAFFWVFLVRSLKYPEIGKRVWSFMFWSMICFGILWGFIALDAFLLNGAAQNSLIQEIQAQATQLRSVLLESKVSPYQLPSGIQLLLEQGPQVWAEKIVSQLIPGLFGLCLTVFFLYWNFFEARGKHTPGPIYLHFRLPDWTMILLVGCMAIWVVSYAIAKNSVGLDEFNGHGFQTFGLTGLMAILGWYGLEGVSLFVRFGSKIRKFWVFFGIVFLFFLSIQFAEAVFIAVGLGAQIRRFMPLNTKKSKK